MKNVGVDPEGSVYLDYFKTGKMIQPHVYKVEGIGEDMLCKALDFSVIDDIRQVDDQQCFNAARRLAREEGIFAGISSAGACWVALQIAAQVEHATIVFVVCDRGDRYLSTGVFPA